MVSYCLRFGVVILISLFALSSLLAQEAVETAKPSEESTPEASPAKAKASKEETPKPAKSLEEQMRPEEFKSAGLDKLNEDELQHIDAYLQGYRESAKKKAAEQANAKAQDEIKKANEKTERAEQATAEAKKDSAGNARTKRDTLVSRVDGNIDGVTGHTIIRLEDGSVWKQVNAVDRSDNRYRATVTDHPTAVV